VLTECPIFQDYSIGGLVAFGFLILESKATISIFFYFLSRATLTHKWSFFIFKMFWNRSLFLQFLSKRRSLIFGVYYFINLFDILRFGFKIPNRVYNSQTTMGTTRTLENVFPVLFQHSNGCGKLDNFGYGLEL
jgi:hypothetical protein